ncbi:MAG: HEAT repeat domain-containing protein [Candidatus Flexifilum sp.]
MGFDLQNFGLGLLAGWGSAYGVYRARHVIRGAIKSVSKTAQSAQTSATRSADSRYINDLVELAQSTHLGGEAVRLSTICVEPRFIPAHRLAAPPDDDEGIDIYSIIPLLPDMPALFAPYNIPTLSIDDLARGSHRIALLGNSGSGRTTALMAMALYSLNEISFAPPIDKIQQQVDSEEAALSEKERSVRVRERVLMEQRAKEKLASARGQTFDASLDQAQQAKLPLFKRLMPVYAHLADITAPSDEFSGEIDPAEPLVRAVQYTVNRITASTIPGSLYKRLTQGDTLLLIDGYDDLSPTDRQKALAWLRAMLDLYGENFFVVVGPVIGHGDLTDLGLTPVYLRPWHNLDIERLVNRWADQWVNVSAGRSGRRKRGAARPDEAAVRRALSNNQALPPVELTGKIWANFSDRVETAGSEGWLRTLIGQMLPEDMTFDEALRFLPAIAAVQLDEGLIRIDRLKTLAIGDDEARSTRTTERAAVSPDQSEDAAKAAQKKPATEEEVESATSQGRLLARLTRSGLLIRHKGNRYAFRHAVLAAYFASFTLAEASIDQLKLKASIPAWKQAVAYAAYHRSLHELVIERLQTPQDLLYSHLFEMARWVPYASPDESWRGEILRDLGNLLIAPNLYPALRERAAAALIETREKSALIIFRRAVRSANPTLRRLACLGMGALGDPEALKDLSQLPRADRTPEVQWAAAMALGAIGTAEAFEAMIAALEIDSEPLLQAIAEAFALHPDEGYPILLDASRHEDMMLRRAAVFGLRRVPTTWALIELYRRFLEDTEWYVRSAAQHAFEELNEGLHRRYAESYPPIAAIPWLKNWVEQRGEQIPTGEAARSVLTQVLQTGSVQERALAAMSIGQLGIVELTRPLYQALCDRQDEVRAAAHKGLSELQVRLGIPLPAPN